MNLEGIKAAVVSKTARQALLLSKHSPKILFVAGTVGVIGTVVLACKATLKVSTVLDNHDKEFKRLVEVATDAALDESKSVASVAMVEFHQKQATHLKFQTAAKLAKLYLPAIGLGALSIGALTGSHVILSRRNATTLAAFAGINQAYKEYRQRVANEYGEDVDRKFLVGAETISIEEKTAEGGVKVTEAAALPKVRSNGRSDYWVVFDERSHHFSKAPGANADTVMMKQNWANDKLRSRGHLFLNEVYDLLGLPRTEAGQIVGWVFRNDDETKKRIEKGLPVGDNYVSFGVFDGDTEFIEAFLDGDEKYAVLDFNVDGPIHKLI